MLLMGNKYWYVHFRGMGEGVWKSVLFVHSWKCDIFGWPHTIISDKQLMKVNKKITGKPIWEWTFDY